jgi:hypothetical protein
MEREQPDIIIIDEADSTDEVVDQLEVLIIRDVVEIPLPPSPPEDIHLRYSVRRVNGARFEPVGLPQFHREATPAPTPEPEMMTPPVSVRVVEDGQRPCSSAQARVQDCRHFQSKCHQKKRPQFHSRYNSQRGRSVSGLSRNDIININKTNKPAPLKKGPVWRITRERGSELITPHPENYSSFGSQRRCSLYHQQRMKLERQRIHQLDLQLDLERRQLAREREEYRRQQREYLKELARFEMKRSQVLRMTNLCRLADGTPVCFNCQKPGHVVDVCREQRRPSVLAHCFRCGRKFAHGVRYKHATWCRYYKPT